MIQSIAYYPEVSGANGQRSTKGDARQSLATAVELTSQDRREDGLRGLPDDSIQETVKVG